MRLGGVVYDNDIDFCFTEHGHKTIELSQSRTLLLLYT